jgi:hypothetical protein
MQAFAQQKLSGSSFVGGYVSGIPAHFQSIRSTVMNTQILHWRGFDAHVPAYRSIARNRTGTNIIGMSFRLVRNLSLFSEGFPTRFACGNDSP